MLAYVCAYMLSCFRHFVTLWVVAHQAPLSMGFFRQEYWSGLPFPLPGDLPNPGIEPRDRTPLSPVLGRQVLHHWRHWEALLKYLVSIILRKEQTLSAFRVIPNPKSEREMKHFIT